MTRPVAITIEHIVTALALPASSRVDQRVPKKMLTEHGAPTTSDRRLLTEGVEELQWIAALKPGTVAIPEYRVNGREYLEVAVLGLHVRATHGKTSQMLRLAELVHRAVPYPVLLVQAVEEGASTTPMENESARLTMSQVHKRASQNEAGRVVLDGDLVCTELDSSTPDTAAVTAQLLEALAMDRQPHQNLMALYQGWMDCQTAAEAAHITGRFRMTEDANQAAIRREALRTCQRLKQEAARLRALAATETQIAKRVELNLTLQRVQEEQRAAMDAL